VERDPVKIVSPEAAFAKQVKVRATRDFNGWVDRGDRSGKPVKWALARGRIGYMDEAHAREFAAKGYVEILDGKVRPVSSDELAEFRSQMTTIGVPNG
jgi:hypothetical protein